MMEDPVIVTTTPRLIMAKIGPEDTNRLFQLTGDPRVMRFFPKVLNYAETRRMVDKIVRQDKQYGYCFWKLLQKDSQVFIGIAGLLHQTIDGRIETEISYRIKPAFWNQGYASEAACACKTFAENILHKKRLISIIHPGNSASKRVAEKLGAKKSKVTTFLGTRHEIHVY